MTSRERKYHKKKKQFHKIRAEFQGDVFFKSISFAPLPIFEELVESIIKDVKND